MARTRILGSIAAAALGITLLGACSTDALTEAAVSFGLEQAIEGNEDIDLDFGEDGSGGFSISTEEGDFALSFDEDNGGITFNTDEGDGAISFDEDGIVFDTDEGDGVISFDEDGIVFDTDAGDGVISFDEDNGEIVFDTDAGDGVISLDEDNGTVSFESDEGSAVFGTTQVPENWPSEVGIPATAVAETMSFGTIETPEGTMLTASFEHAAGDPFAANAESALVAAGWETVSAVDTPGARQVQLQNGESFAMIISQGELNTSVTIMLAG